MDNGVALEGDDDDTNISLGWGRACNSMMKFISIIVGMVAGAASLIVYIFCFVIMSQQLLPKPLKLLVKYKLNSDGDSHI